MSERSERNEACPECGADAAPTNLPAVKYDEIIDFYVRLERYDCPKCRWRWANAAQRERNAAEYKVRKTLAFQGSKRR